MILSRGRVCSSAVSSHVRARRAKIRERALCAAAVIESYRANTMQTDGAAAAAGRAALSAEGKLLLNILEPRLE